MQTAIDTLSKTGYTALESEAIAISTEFMQKHSGGCAGSEKRFAIRVIRPGADSHWIAQWLEAQRFKVEFDDEPLSRLAAWRGYEDDPQKTFSIVAFERSQQGSEWLPRGVMRVLQGEALPDFKSVANMAEFWGREVIHLLEEGYQLDWKSTWDVATLAMSGAIPLKSDLDALRVPLALLHTLRLLMQECKVQWLLGILASKTYAELDRMKLGLISLGAEVDYHRVLSKPFLLIEADLEDSMSACPGYASIVLRGEKLSNFDISLAE